MAPADPGLVLLMALVEATEGKTVRWLPRVALLPAGDAAFERLRELMLSITAHRLSVRLEDGATDRAGVALERLVEALPPHRALLRLLALVRFIQGREAEAGELLARVSSLAADGDADGAVGEAAGAVPVREAGLERALRALEKRRRDHRAVGSVVIPAYRVEGCIGRALDSVDRAVRYYRQEAGDPDARFHICVVDDASPDGTVEAVRAWSRAHPDHSLSLIANSGNGGAGRSRNLGAAMAMGPYLWFLDADDWFLDRHLWVTATMLDRHPEIGFVRTGIRFDSIDRDITPVWRSASEATYPCNLAVRRVCHDLIGGFPDEEPFNPAGPEDVCYSKSLQALFAGVKTEEQTVCYTLGDGNVFDRLKADMLSGRPPGQGAPPEPVHLAAELLIRRRLYALEARRGMAWDGPPILPGRSRADDPPAVEPGRHDARDAHDAHDGRPDSAVTALRAAVALDPGRIEGWNRLAMAIHAAQGPAASVPAFRRVRLLLPEMASTHLNLGNVLFDSGRWPSAETSLRQALALDPARAYALFQLGRVAGRTGRADAACRLLARAARLESPVSPVAADIGAEMALALRDCGRWQDAARQGRRTAALVPGRYDVHLALAAAAEAEGRPAAALSAYERAIRCHPGFGEAFTRRAVLLLRQSWKAPAPRLAAGRVGRRLAATELGRNGRFGNQLLQYGFLRLYAARHDLDLEVPDWVGRYLYDCDDPLPGDPLPRVSEEDHDFFASLSGAAPVWAECDLTGYFCRHTAALAPYRTDFRRLFMPGRYLWPRADAIEHRLRARGRTVVALHLRRGDYGWGRFWVAQELWYRTWLEQLWADLDSPVLYLATDAPELAEAFAPFSPILATDLDMPLAGAEFFTDFHALCVADVLAISNSTFSFTAGLLNRTARRFVRPDRHRRMLVSYDPWDAEVLL